MENVHSLSLPTGLQKQTELGSLNMIKDVYLILNFCIVNIELIFYLAFGPKVSLIKKILLFLMALIVGVF